jgi:phosphopantothenate---cysteine ligase (CTP)
MNKKIMKILITGGPVHAYLDDVKLITNKFKGGLMANLAEMLMSKGDVEVTYLTTRDSKHPQSVEVEVGDRINKVNATVLFHDGIHDYRKQVLELAPKFDAVILGAAVANLIPLNPFVGKFPSHNYKVGDKIPIEFTIAPRIIDEVKKVAPNVHLFGFKLLSGVPHEELISAAYGVLLESHATAVFANDRKDLLHKYAVTKERGVHPMNMEDMAKFIVQCVQDEYYRTTFSETPPPSGYDFTLLTEFYTLLYEFKDQFEMIPEGYTFGTIATRHPHGGFLTTGRGKHEIADTIFVKEVIHNERLVIVHSKEKKASLNAPLLDWIFRNNPNVKSIVHVHNHDLWTLRQEYAPPGTVRDSQRNVTKSFFIENHGAFYLLDKNDNIIM